MFKYTKRGSWEKGHLEITNLSLNKHYHFVLLFVIPLFCNMMSVVKAPKTTLATLIGHHEDGAH